jgi:hypothetical protein
MVLSEVLEMTIDAFGHLLALRASLIFGLGACFLALALACTGIRNAVFHVRARRAVARVVAQARIAFLEIRHA